ncbi:MAG: hypothetical protein KGI25_03535 [Thaumarchaeota archaeon]|nr:hypothetical protein [Nitrososphaerota archaeon]
MNSNKTTKDKIEDIMTVIIEVSRSNDRLYIKANGKQLFDTPDTNIAYVKFVDKEATSLLNRELVKARIDELSEIPYEPNFLAEYIKDRISALELELEEE